MQHTCTYEMSKQLFIAKFVLLFGQYGSSSPSTEKFDDLIVFCQFSHAKQPKTLLHLPAKTLFPNYFEYFGACIKQTNLFNYDAIAERIGSTMSSFCREKLIVRHKDVIYTAAYFYFGKAQKKLVFQAVRPTITTTS